MIQDIHKNDNFQITPIINLFIKLQLKHRSTKKNSIYTSSLQLCISVFTYIYFISIKRTLVNQLKENQKRKGKQKTEVQVQQGKSRFFSRRVFSNSSNPKWEQGDLKHRNWSSSGRQVSITVLILLLIPRPWTLDLVKP